MWERLIYASADAGPVQYGLTGSGVQICVHGLDLSAPLATLRSQITAIAQTIAAGASSASPTSTTVS